MKILVTGGLGFIFSHVVEKLYKSGHNLTIVDAMLDGSNLQLVDKFKKMGIKIQKEKCEFLEEYDIDYDVIIHAAAESNVDKSINEIKPFIDSNIRGTINMLDIARKQENLKKFYYISTDEVSGSTEHYVKNYNEFNPSNPYAASKAAGAHFVWSYFNTYNLPVQEIRMCNVIGKRQDDTKLIPYVINCLKNNKEICVYGDGLATREYIDVRDVVNIISHIIDEFFLEEVCAITYSQELSILEVIMRISSIIGIPAKIKTGERLGHDMHYRMNPSYTMKYFKRPIPFIETIEWMIN